MINHNNTISAGRDKRDVVKPLLRLHDAGIILPPKKMAEWAIAHGWRRGNPKELIELAKKINKGVGQVLWSGVIVLCPSEWVMR